MNLAALRRSRPPPDPLADPARRHSSGVLRLQHRQPVRDGAASSSRTRRSTRPAASFDTTGPRLPTQRNTATALVTEPKVTALGAGAPPLTLTASYGQGAQSLDAVYITQDERRPSPASSPARRAPSTTGASAASICRPARSATTPTSAGPDLQPRPGRLTPSTGTTATAGWCRVRATGRWFDELASATYAYATYDADGTLVPYVPSVIARSDTAVFGPLGRAASSATAYRARRGSPSTS